jgi:hypothetical protein
VSAEKVTLFVPLPATPAAFVPVIVLAPGAVAPGDQLYEVDSYGDPVSVPPPPLQPTTAVRSGKVTLATLDSLSLAVAASTNVPPAAGLKKSVPVMLSKNWPPAFVPSVVPDGERAGPVVSTLTTVETEAALPTLSVPVSV